MNTFVANRVADIQESTPEVDWRHVPTKENPADLVSRGCTVDELNASFWFKGPDFLAKDSNGWPKNPHFSLSPDNSRLEKRKVATVFTAADVSPNPIIKLVEDCSSYFKILRIVAYILRIVWCITNRKRCSEFSSLAVSVQELESALLTVVSIVQQDRFLTRQGPVIRLHCDNAMEFASNFINHGNAMVEFAAQRGTEFVFMLRTKISKSYKLQLQQHPVVRCSSPNIAEPSVWTTSRTRNPIAEILRTFGNKSGAPEVSQRRCCLCQRRCQCIELS
ncbi:hypothetical protein ACLKA6_009774 [Drosophila palustris]